MINVAVPTEVVAIYNKALDLSNKGDLDSAIKEYRKAITMFPSFIEAYNNIGEIYSRMGNRDLAISSYKEALNIKRNYRVLLNLGVEYYNNNDHKTAIKYFFESLSLKSDFLEGNFYSGMAFFNMKDYANAEKYFSNVIRLDNRHVKTNYLLAFIYYEWKKYYDTLRCLDNIKDFADDKVFLNKYYGFCYYHLGRFDDALKYLSTALELNPKYDKYKDYLKGLTYESKMKEIGDIDKKIQEMEKTIMKDRPSLSEYTHLSMLYIFKGEYKKAENLLLKAQKK